MAFGGGREVVEDVSSCDAPPPPAGPLPRFVRICVVIGVVSLVLLPALAIGLAAWKYKQETAAQHNTQSLQPLTK